MLKVALQAGATLLSWALLYASTFAGPIDTLQPGQWYEVPNSKLSAVFPNPLPPLDPAGVISAYSGGAYDSDRNRLIVWGGGHNNYGGNEIYAFDVATLKWLRLTNPSTGTPTGETMPDGNPTSIHTYDQLEYIPLKYAPAAGAGKFFSTNGSMYPTGNATAATWYFNFVNNSWERLTDTPGGLYSGVIGYSLTTDWDPVRKKVFIVGNKDSANFNPADGSWTVHGQNRAEQPHGQTGALDPVRRKFVTIGRGFASSYTLDSNGVAGVRSALGATGATEIQNVDAPAITRPLSARTPCHIPRTRHISPPSLTFRI